MAGTGVDTIRHPKKRAFLAAYAACGNVTLAAEGAGIHRTLHYRWLGDDLTYADAFRQAEEQAADRLEQAARARAVGGVESRRLILYRGEPVIDWSVPGAWVDDGGKPWREGSSRGRKRWTGAFLYEVETKYSDTLLIFLLKGARPDKYAERHKHDHKHDIRKAAEETAAEIGKPELADQIERDILLSIEAVGR